MLFLAPIKILSSYFLSSSVFDEGEEDVPVFKHVHSDYKTMVCVIIRYLPYVSFKRHSGSSAINSFFLVL